MRGDTSPQKLFVVVALCWDKTKVKHPENVCLCVCVYCLSIYSGRQACRHTSWGHTGGRSHRTSSPFFCGAFLHFSREKDFSHSFPSSIVKTNIVYPRVNRSPLVRHFIIFNFFFL